MIRFLVKSAFILGTIAFFVPGFGPETQQDEDGIDLFRSMLGARQAIDDLAGFCERAPAACETGSGLADFAGARIGAGLEVALDLAGKAAETASSARNDGGGETSGPEKTRIDPLLLETISELDLDAGFAEPADPSERLPRRAPRPTPRPQFGDEL